MQITVRRYAGLRAWMKYMGVKMPSLPASAMAAAQRFKAKLTISAGTGLGNRLSRKKKIPTGTRYLEDSGGGIGCYRYEMPPAMLTSLANSVTSGSSRSMLPTRSAW